MHANNPIIVGIVFDPNFAANPQNVDVIQYKIRLTDSFRNNGGDGGSCNTDQIFQNGVISDRVIMDRQMVDRQVGI